MSKPMIVKQEAMEEVNQPIDLTSPRAPPCDRHRPAAVNRNEEQINNHVNLPGPAQALIDGRLIQNAENHLDMAVALVGVTIKRKYYFMGQIFKHAGEYEIFTDLTHLSPQQRDPQNCQLYLYSHPEILANLTEVLSTLNIYTLHQTDGVGPSVLELEILIHTTVCHHRHYHTGTRVSAGNIFILRSRSQQGEPIDVCRHFRHLDEYLHELAAQIRQAAANEHRTINWRELGAPTSSITRFNIV